MPRRPVIRHVQRAQRRSTIKKKPGSGSQAACHWRAAAGIEPVCDSDGIKKAACICGKCEECRAAPALHSGRPKEEVLVRQVVIVTSDFVNEEHRSHRFAIQGSPPVSRSEVVFSRDADPESYARSSADTLPSGSDGAGHCVSSRDLSSTPTLSDRPEKRCRSVRSPPSDFRQAGGTSRAPAARSSSTEIKCRSLTDSLQKFCLGWFHFHEQRQNIQDIEQLSRVLGQPVVGLDVAELGRRPAVANDRPFAVLFTVAEPLRQHTRRRMES